MSTSNLWQHKKA